MNKHTVIGIDLAKSIFQVCIVDARHQKVRTNKALRRHQVRLIAPQFVTPFRKGHKTDANDALAIAEAGLRPDMRFVTIKGLEQQDIQSLHRIRDVHIKQRTQLIGIGRTGQSELKAALIRGAHAVIKVLGDKQDAKSRWLRALVHRAGANKAAVALANKTVRTAWAMLHNGQAYQKDRMSSPI